jgi:UDP-glucose 4-epimerase
MPRIKEFAMFEGRTILITGGTGTFGNAVVNRYLKSDIAQIRIFSRDEMKQETMRSQICDERVKFFIGDVREPSSLVVPMTGVDYVFHAAALKQVPSCEFFPLEAVRTNILGAENVFSTAVQCGVKNVIALSTDKAVYPISAMGMSKAMMEKILVAKARSYTDPVFCGTRYGNVMASRGSVIPLFIRQIKSGQPLTVTDPNMTRFMMSIDEAVDLVVYAFQQGRAGDIFIKKAPAATILTVAEALKEMFSAKNEIKIIGTRHGEKHYEMLVTYEEMARAEDLGDYYRVPLDARDLNYALYFTTGRKERTIDGSEYTSHNTHRLNLQETISLLSNLEFVKEELCRSAS